MALIALFLGGCGSTALKKCEPVTLTEYKYRVPELPAKHIEPTKKPVVDTWEGKTQKDVKDYIIRLHESIDEGNLKLQGIEEYLDSLREKENAND